MKQRLSTHYCPRSLPQVAEVLQALLVRPSCLLSHLPESGSQTRQGEGVREGGRPRLPLGAHGFDGVGTGPGPQGVSSLMGEARL